MRGADMIRLILIVLFAAMALFPTYAEEQVDEITALFTELEEGNISLLISCLSPPLMQRP